MIDWFEFAGIERVRLCVGNKSSFFSSQQVEISILVERTVHYSAPITVITDNISPFQKFYRWF